MLLWDVTHSRKQGANSKILGRGRCKERKDDVMVVVVWRARMIMKCNFQYGVLALARFISHTKIQ